MRYLNLADFLLIAEAVLGMPAEDLYRTCDIGLAEAALKAPNAVFADVEVHATVAAKAAVLGYRLCRNQPLLAGNRQVAYLAVREFMARNGYTWTPPRADGSAGDETVKLWWDVASGQLSENELARWLAERIGESS